VIWNQARYVLPSVVVRRAKQNLVLMQGAGRRFLPIYIDTFGQPAEIDVIRESADRHGLKVIEDSCESLGSEYKGVRCGNGAFVDGAVWRLLSQQSWRRGRPPTSTFNPYAMRGL